MGHPVIEALNAYGCKTSEAMERFLGKEDLYLRFLGKFLEDTSYDESARVVPQGNPEESLKSVHKLKGVSGNLGLTPLYEVAADMVARYRADDPMGADAEFDELSKRYHEVYDIIESNLKT